MTDTQEKAGTPEPDDRDASAGSTTGTPATDGRDAPGDADTALALTWKANLEKERERARQLEARLQQVERERQGQTPAASGDADPRAKRERMVRYYADNDDPLAAELLDLRQTLSDVVSGIGVMSQINAIEDEEERKAVRKAYLDSLQNGTPADIRTVTAETRAARVQAENERLRAQLAKSAGKVPDRDVVRTAVREVPASETKARVMTRREFDEEAARLRREQGDNAVRAFKRQVLTDQVIVTD